MCPSEQGGAGREEEEEEVSFAGVSACVRASGASERSQLVEKCRERRMRVFGCVRA